MTTPPWRLRRDDTLMTARVGDGRRSRRGRSCAGLALRKTGETHTVRAARKRWNLNIHYHRVVLAAASPRVGMALDVGCGEGLLTFDLAERGATVVGIDPDAPSIGRAQADPRASTRTRFICGDVFTYPFEHRSFDLVASSAMLHHVDARSGLRRMRELVRPGGVVVVVGFGRPSGLRDRALAVAGAAIKRWRQIRGHCWEHGAPICWPPPLTTKQMAMLGSVELPGSSFRRLMSNRYVIVWKAPVAERQVGTGRPKQPWDLSGE